MDATAASAKAAPKPKKLLGIKIRKATVAEADLPTPEEESLSIIPSGLPASEVQPEERQAIKTFFKAPAASVAKPIAVNPVAATTIAKVSKASTDLPLPVAAAAKGPSGSVKPIISTKVEQAVAGLGAAAVDEAVQPQPKPQESIDFSESEFADLAAAIQAEESRSPYTVPEPSSGYVPQTHRGFSDFIKETYRQFALPPLPSEPDYDACLKLSQGAEKAENYQYQQFVRDYMSWGTPYRGILVYHGLGSGKTCTAIAAAEALYSTANRRIIVMTPFSLRKNFLREITFCGFRHFRLLNHWVSFPNDPTTQPMIRLFASKVLNIPVSYLAKAKRIWVPDFTKPANYTSLSSAEQTEIREQIQQILIFDPEKKRNGRIWFINYNGITASKLKMLACQGDKSPFDNAVIVVDEVHNLVRLMQGTIEPYLTELKGVKRKIAPEPITTEKWSPRLCGKTMNYKRGYILYRLLIGARNSKIIGLSGTPLINFPEELGILMNVLHGYLHIAEGRVQRGANTEEEMKIKEQIESIARENRYIDFYRVTIDDNGVKFIVTTLPEGIRKVEDQIGVERIPLDEPVLSFQERLDNFKADLDTNRINLVSAMRTRAEPLLPPTGEKFQETFIGMDSIAIKNRLVLLKRISGLVSYYKGSRKDLMPAVTKDEVIRVPFSLYQQDKYSQIRLEEIDIEKSKDKQKTEGGIGAGKLGALWAEIYEIKNLKQSANYRMGSRQSCNFTFPPSVARPRPRNQTEAEEEVGADPDDLMDALPDGADGQEDDDLSVILQEEREVEGAAEEEDNETDAAAEKAYLEEERARLSAEGLSNADITRRLEEALADYKASQYALVLPSAKEATETALTQELTAEEKRCRTPMIPGETYKTAITRSKKCLATQGRSKLLLDAPEGLGDLSPKFKTMITKINEAKGSSLVYSQFLEMEGIGIFTLVLQANGFEPIVIEMSATGPRFSEATVASLRKGPAANQGRYITFTGGESEEVRRYAVDVFNAKFSELPKQMSDILKESGYVNNQRGDLCRVFCITSAGAEGLSLKNVRAVHIMEPYWNDVRMAQVKGRAVRICSHMDIQPPSERTVEIFTYVTVFGPEAQLARSGPMKIAEQITMRDSLTLKEAQQAKLPIPAGAQHYVLTSDERLLVIAQRKKAVIENLSRVMKSAAVDCQLNFNENADGTFQCALFGKVGDFMYHPDLVTDIAETNDIYGEDATGTTAAVSVVPGAEAGEAQATRKVLRIKMGEKAFVLAQVIDPVTKKATRYDIFLPTDALFQNRVGEVQVDEVTGGPKKGTAKFFKQ